ncbi:MAG: hypothetical protein NZ959_05605 [Armatimonadetes bacterium]|nr:hypothetical protein [Armatimonadota bacterium]MDW8122044.1 hypothetical protein [Armatimonadota bacterium]
MSRRDRFLTELFFIGGLLLLPADSGLGNLGIAALIMSSGLASAIAWELPRLLFSNRVAGMDQLASSVALTLVLFSFYLGKSDAAVAQVIKERGQNAAFSSPQWLMSDIVLAILTLSVMLTLLALTTLFLHHGEGRGLAWLKNLPRTFGRGLVGLLIGTGVGLGAGAWSVAASTVGLPLSLSSWIAMWCAVESGRVFQHWSFVARLGVALLAGVVGGAATALLLRSPQTALAASFTGAIAAVSYQWLHILIPSENPARPKDAPLHVPWVGFYTLRFAGLVVAYFVFGTPFLWGFKALNG